MKRIVFVSDFLEHHTLPLCEVFFNNNNVDFFYVATTPTPESRLKLGYEDMNNKFDFVIKAYESKSNKKEAYEIIKKADLVILGGVWGEYSKLCCKNDIPTMRISERFLKGDVSTLQKLLKVIKYKILSKPEKKFLLLCCGKYAAEDFKLTKNYENRIVRFGYFPKVDTVEFEPKKDNNSIVWAGRMIDWKHPEIILELADYLYKKQMDFVINVVGDGPLLTEFKKQLDTKPYKNKIKIYGALNYQDVRKIMLSSQIHIFTSDSSEGWGAVLNESMSCKCIPVVDERIGASTYLINDGVNGFLYTKPHELYDSVLKIFAFDDKNMKTVSNNAFTTIEKEWNCLECAKRIIGLSDDYDSRGFYSLNKYNEGPLSLEK